MRWLVCPSLTAGPQWSDCQSPEWPQYPTILYSPNKYIPKTKYANVSTHRLHSSSFLRFICRIRLDNPEQDLLWSLWVAERLA